ncbi:hypothetical protein Tco_1008948, partial [Tanacetum coccineum]
YGSRFDTTYWRFLGVGTTFDIFQNIHILYLEYGVLSLFGYGVLSFIPEWSLVSAGTDTPYLPLWIRRIDSDEFSVHEMDSILEDSRHDDHRVMFYHFLKPFCNLDNVLEPLASDKDVVLLAKYAAEGLKLVEMYVEREKT